jgi:hypothetical protein
MSAQGKHINAGYWDPSDAEYVSSEAASPVRYALEEAGNIIMELTFVKGAGHSFGWSALSMPAGGRPIRLRGK